MREEHATLRLLAGVLRLRRFTASELANHCGVKLSTTYSFLDRYQEDIYAQPERDVLRRGRPTLRYRIRAERESVLRKRLDSLRADLAPTSEEGLEPKGNPPETLPSLVTLEAMVNDLEKRAGADIEARRGTFELAELLMKGTEQANRDREEKWGFVNLFETQQLLCARDRLKSLRAELFPKDTVTIPPKWRDLSKKTGTLRYDLLIKNARVVDGSGMPSFRGDVAAKNGIIIEIGKLSGPAKRTIDAEGLVVAPGFVDNHCHYDAQVTRDPLCSFSPDHGATTVIFGNCSLAMAPVRRGTEKRVAEFLSFVEAIPIEVLDTLEFDWETIPQYMNRLDHHLGVNVGNLIGHSTVRYYVMGEESQTRTAREDEIKKMQDVVRDGIKAGALGLSVSRNTGHYDHHGGHIPTLWADEKEIFALGDVLRELNTGVIQSAGGRSAELEDGLMARLSEVTGRTVVYNHLMIAENNVVVDPMAKTLTYPNTIFGLSDAEAHAQLHGGYITRLLSESVREKQVITLEQAVRRLTFDSACAFGLYDRGLLRPGMAADIVIFDPRTVRPLPETVIDHIPTGRVRIKEPATGIMATIVNGKVLIENGKHTGAFPGRVLRNTYYHTHT
jgi:N-acyl-D-aspartate/D-glutamate deacylase